MDNELHFIVCLFKELEENCRFTILHFYICSILKLKDGRRKQSNGLKWIQERDFSEHYF